MGISIWQIIILLFLFVVGVLPWIMALLSQKVYGKQKVIWFLLSFFFSWIGYLLYWAMTVRKLPENSDSDNGEFVPHKDNPNRQFPY